MGCAVFERKNRWLLAIVIFVLVAIIAWRWASRSPGVELTFLHTTNSPSGIRGVFEIKNKLSEPVHSAGGFFKTPARKGIDLERGDFVTDVQFDIPGKSVQRFTTWIPTNGQYRLIMPSIPRRKTTPEYYRSLTARAGDFIAGLVHLAGGLTHTVAWRLSGWNFAESETFEASAHLER
jgi:hypothetical protein